MTPKVAAAGRTHLLEAADAPSPGLRVVVWSLVLTSSSLPQIVFTEVAGRQAAVPLAVAQAALLLGVPVA